MMIQTQCAICSTLDNATLLYKERLPSNGIDASAYVARRDRDYYHYQLVKCNGCGLVRSDPIMSNERLAELYTQSGCTYSEKIENRLLKKTYGHYLEKITKTYDVKKEMFLDIGCSNGFLLEKASELGFKKVVGVEPSRESIEKADPDVRSNIVEGMFDGNMFGAEKFDTITFCQTLDHITDPNKFLKDCYKTLKKGGFILAINHNVKSLSAKILGERSPIIDIGHAYLYDFNTMRQIFQKNQFEVKEVFAVKNVVTIDYLIPHLPINIEFKNLLRKISHITKMNRIQLSIYLGNLGIIAQKPL